MHFQERLILIQACQPKKKNDDMFSIEASVTRGHNWKIRRGNAMPAENNPVFTASDPRLKLASSRYCWSWQYYCCWSGNAGRNLLHYNAMDAIWIVLGVILHMHITNILFDEIHYAIMFWTLRKQHSNTQCT